MHSSEKEKLLRDVIAEGDYKQFREELLRSTTREFRRAHRKHSGKTWLALAAMIAFMAVLGAQFFSRNQKQSAASIPNKSQNMASHPESAHMEIVTSTPLADSAVIRTVPSQALVVRTRISLPEISDAQLLAMFKDQGAGFVEGEGGRRFVVTRVLGTGQSERRNFQ